MTFAFSSVINPCSIAALALVRVDYDRAVPSLVCATFSGGPMLRMVVFSWLMWRSWSSQQPKLSVFILVFHNQSANIVKKKREMSSEWSGTFYRSVVCRGLSACIVEGPRNPYPCVNNMGKCCRALWQDIHFPLRQDIFCGQSLYNIKKDYVCFLWIKLIQRSALLVYNLLLDFKW